MINRRSFFKKCGLLGLASVVAPKAVAEAVGELGRS